MNKDMGLIADFDVAECIASSTLSSEEVAHTLDFAWAIKWEGSDIRARLCVRGFNQIVKDLDHTFASTPVLLILKLLIVLALSMSWCIFTFDITTAFLHASLDPTDDPIYVWPPVEYFPFREVIWKLKRAVYGLRTAPREWQDHFAEQLQAMGFKRLKSDGNVYVHTHLQVIVLAYVDDLMVFGNKDHIFIIKTKLNSVFLIKETGNLNNEGSKVRFLGRILQRKDCGILMYEDENYYMEILKEHSMEKCKETNTPSPATSTPTADAEDLVDTDRHSLYRRTVGKLQWQVPVRPDMAFTVKELARKLNGPTESDFKQLKHLLRYLKGSLHYKLYLKPDLNLAPGEKHNFILPAYVDANWAGCVLTRKSSSGLHLEFLGAPIHFISKTQAVRALSSAESELYGIGAGIAESLHVRSFLMEAGIAKSVLIEVWTDSTAAKSIAMSYGTSRKTRHIELKYLYMQDLVLQGLVKIKKVPGEQNPPDIFTKHVKLEVLRRHLHRVGLTVTVEQDIYMIACISSCGSAAFFETPASSSLSRADQTSSEMSSGAASSAQSKGRALHSIMKRDRSPKRDRSEMEATSSGAAASAGAASTLGAGETIETTSVAGSTQEAGPFMHEVPMDVPDDIQTDIQDPLSDMVDAEVEAFIDHRKTHSGEWEVIRTEEEIASMHHDLESFFNNQQGKDYWFQNGVTMQSALHDWFKTAFNQSFRCLLYTSPSPRD